MIRSSQIRSFAAIMFGIAALVAIFTVSARAEETTDRETAAIQPTQAAGRANSFVVDGPYTVQKPVATTAPIVSRSSLPTCFGQAATIFGAYNQYGQAVFNGTNGNDVIVGTVGQDVITGNGGNDLICALDNADIVHAGDGDDTVDAGPGKDSVNGQNGNDAIYGRDGDDLLHGDAGNDYVYGGNGNDGIGGWDGDDVLLGEAGDDTLEGLSGFDQLDGGLGANDFCHGGSTVGGAENDTATNCEFAVAIP
jgi:Ca2+-binding RTX toxin-like protein